MNNITMLDAYRQILKRAEQLKSSELSGDGSLELYWAASLLERTKEINP